MFISKSDLNNIHRQLHEVILQVHRLTKELNKDKLPKRTYVKSGKYSKKGVK